MFKIFIQPHPIESINVRFAVSTAVSLFVYGFLAVLEPFHLNLLESNKTSIILGYGLGCWINLSLFYTLLPTLFPQRFNDANWKVYKEIIWLLTILIIIGINVAVYEDVIGTRPIRTYTLAESIGKTLIIGIIPVTGITLFNQFRLLNKHLVEANEIYKVVVEKESDFLAEEKEAKHIELSSDNKSESFTGVVQDILFVASLGNYVEIYRIIEDHKEKAILRTTLSKIEEQLSSYPQFFRCHRTHLVNLNRITNIEGNARGYDLIFEIPDLVVPVSKRKTAEFRALMNDK